MTTEELPLVAIELVERTEAHALRNMLRELEQERQSVMYSGCSQPVNTRERAERCGKR